MSSQDKIQRLQIYAASLKDRLARPVPAQHSCRAAAFKQMLEIDLKKTLNKIEELSK